MIICFDAEAKSARRDHTPLPRAPSMAFAHPRAGLVNLTPDSILPGFPALIQCLDRQSKRRFIAARLAQRFGLLGKTLSDETDLSHRMLALQASRTILTRVSATVSDRYLEDLVANSHLYD